MRIAKVNRKIYNKIIGRKNKVTSSA
jgi:hypothetical protein